MEIADVRRQVAEAIVRAKRAAADRRARADEAAAEYSSFLESVAVPLFRQVAMVLKADGYPFTVFTPGGGVRLVSDRNAEDYIELLLHTSGPEVVLMGHTSRRWGRDVIEAEHPIAAGPVRNISDRAVLDFLVKELELHLER